MPWQTVVIPDILLWPLVLIGASALAFLLYFLVERWATIRDQVRRWSLPLLIGLAALTVLSRRRQQPDEPPLDLQNTDLRGSDLKWLHLERAFFWRSHLEEADLSGAYLERTQLHQVRLQGASLRSAHLERADLKEAHLEGAVLMDAHLEGADFSLAHLEKAFFHGAHLKGAHLKGAYLGGADLSGASGLTREQLAQAIIDANTRLPAYLAPLQELAAVPISGGVEADGGVAHGAQGQTLMEIAGFIRQSSAPCPGSAPAAVIIVPVEKKKPGNKEQPAVPEKRWQRDRWLTLLVRPAGS